VVCKVPLFIAQISFHNQVFWPGLAPEIRALGTQLMTHLWPLVLGRMPSSGLNLTHLTPCLSSYLHHSPSFWIRILTKPTMELSVRYHNKRKKMGFIAQKAATHDTCVRGKLCGFIHYNVQYVVFIVGYTKLHTHYYTMYVFLFHYLMSNSNFVYATINITYCTL
jgi:hypothetical protein